MIFKQISADSDRTNHADVWRRSPDIGNKKRGLKRKKECLEYSMQKQKTVKRLPMHRVGKRTNS